MARTAIDILDRFLHQRTLWFACLVVAFAVSAIATFGRPYARPATLWFPARNGTGSVSEIRYMRDPHDGSLPEALLSEELLLGPANSGAKPIAVPSTDLRLVLRSSNALYVDVSAQILFGKQMKGGVYLDPPLEPRMALSYLERALRWNFPRKRLVLTVEGRQPDERTQEEQPPSGAETVKKE